MAVTFLDSLNRRLRNYQRRKEQNYQVETIYASVLGPLSAAVAAHAVSNVWQGVQVIPLADADEIHFAYMLPHNVDLQYPTYIRWVLLPNNDTAAATITTTVDKVDMTRNLTGSDLAADGATALDTVIPAIVAGETTTSIPFASDWGIVVGSATLYDCLFFKLVASGASAADRLRVVALQVATRRIKHKGMF